MKLIICDETLKEAGKISFKEKLDIAKNLDNLCVDFISVGPVLDKKTDSILFRTISSFLKNSSLVSTAVSTKASVDLAIDAIKNASKKVVSIVFPASVIEMEYMYHKKPQAMLDLISELVAYAKANSDEVEVVLDDATRAEKEFLYQAVNNAVTAGADMVCINDTAGIYFPNEFNDFIKDIKNNTNKVKLGIGASNAYKLASASVLASIEYIDYVKTSAFGKNLPALENVCNIVSKLGDKHNITMKVKSTSLSEIVHAILSGHASELSITEAKTIDDVKLLDENVTKEELVSVMNKLGYELSGDDNEAVYETFKRLAIKKGSVKLKELDVIVANTAMQVPQTYILDSYLINSGNKIKTIANITLKKNGVELSGLCNGDGPVDAAFKAIASITGRSYELDDFQVKAATEGTEALGEALVKLRYNGKLYSGSGISTDINGASIRAYLQAVNKIAYEDNK